MSKFKIGQRTYIRMSTSHPHLVREHGTIVGRNLLRFWKDNTGCGCGRRYLWRCDGDGLTYKAQEECLAPIYDGDEKTSWSESAWVPKPMRKLTAKNGSAAPVEHEIAVSK